jgi:hypothetical protein
VASPIARGRRGFELIARRSGNGGRTWSRAAPIARLAGRSARGRGRAIRAPTWLSSAAAGPGDSVVAAWVDIRSPRRALVRVVRSGDGGRRFGAPVTVARVEGQAFVPAVAVTADGTIGVSYDAFGPRAGRGGGLPTSVRLATSADAGLTWHRTRISGPFDLRRASTRGSGFVGDYQGMVALADGFATLFARTSAARGRGRTDVVFAVCRAPGDQAIC